MRWGRWRVRGVCGEGEKRGGGGEIKTSECLKL